MILSVSRRTDIPAFYADWFFERLHLGYVQVANPFNSNQIRRVDLARPFVDGMVFWTRNPRPMLHRLAELDGYPFYFQMTINAYGPEIEPHVPNLDASIEALRLLSSKIGPARIIWRYDPIFLSPIYTIQYHLEHFNSLAVRLAGWTSYCTISFMDPYRKIMHAMRQHALRVPEVSEMDTIAGGLAGICRDSGLSLQTCAEAADFEKYGIKHGACIDAIKLAAIGGSPVTAGSGSPVTAGSGSPVTAIGGSTVTAGRDKNQRPACRCSVSVDLGSYDSCRFGCIYCYANSRH